MNILFFIGRVLSSIGLATGVSITLAVFSLILLGSIVNLFRLNYLGQTYWVLNLCLFIFWISWILSFTYYMVLLK
jgi:hypothetical protein